MTARSSSARHVDHAHQAKRDREAQRAEQENASRAHSIEDVGKRSHEHLTAIELLERVLGHRAHPRIGLCVRAIASPRRDCLKPRTKTRRARLLNGVDRPETALRVIACQIGLGKG